MNKSTKIYFLSALVLIIGCAALNLSYSLFVQTEEKSAVESVVPSMDSKLSLDSLTLSNNEEVIIKETISNTGSVDFNYVLNYSGTNFDVKLVNKDNNSLNGILKINETKDIYLYIKNTSDIDNTISFTLEKNYTTLNNNLVSNIKTYDLYQVIKYGEPYKLLENSLNYSIINSYLSEKDEDKILSSVEIDELLKDNNTLMLPLYSDDNIDIVNNFTLLDESGLYKMQDDYGMSYYLRGNILNNNVSFANKLWKIIRINGDGSIRLILNDSISSNVYSNTLGYVTLDNDIKQDSLVKEKIDKWYEDNILNDYSEYLNDTLFCENKNSFDRLYYSEDNKNINPTLECVKETGDKKYRYTVGGLTTIKGVETNDYLKYPIALISADEVVLAGLINNEVCNDNKSNYLYSSVTNWTMTPISGESEIFTISSETCLGKSKIDNSVGMRPVINLKSNLIVDSGDGTETNPYVLKLSD